MKRSKYELFLLVVFPVISFFLASHVGQGLRVARAESISGRFDASGGSNILTGSFISNILPQGEAPLVDAQIQAVLQSGGFDFEPLGWSFTGVSEWCDDGILFGNLYFTADPRLTAPWGAETIVFIPAGMRCGGQGDSLFGTGETILVIYIGPQVPAGYFAPVDVIPWSGGNVVIAGSDDMILLLE